MLLLSILTTPFQMNKLRPERSTDLHQQAIHQPTSSHTPGVSVPQFLQQSEGGPRGMLLLR